MSLANQTKKKKDADSAGVDLDLHENNTGLKITNIDEDRYKIRGNAGYETVFVKKIFKEGAYCVKMEDLTLVGKKGRQKQCIRFGVYCQTEEDEAKKRNSIFSLGSCTNSLAIRTSDMSIIHNGQVVGKLQIPLNAQNQEEQANDGNSMRSEPLTTPLYFENLQLHIVLSLSSPKNPELIKYYHDKLPSSDLLYSEKSFIAIFCNGTLSALVKNIREGEYSIGVSMFNESQAELELDSDSFLKQAETTSDEQKPNALVLEWGRNFATSTVLPQEEVKAMLDLSPINKIRDRSEDKDLTCHNSQRKQNTGQKQERKMEAMECE